jgi:TPR repeat protein
MSDFDIHAQAPAGGPEAMLSLALRLEGELDEYDDNADTEQQIENLLRGAAEHGLPRALAELGSFLWLVREDDEEAVVWLLRAADAGQADAMNLLGDVHDFREEPGAAIAWYTKAVELGDEKAAQSLAALRDM